MGKKNEAKAISRYIENDVWEASVMRGSNDAYNKEYQKVQGWVMDSHKVNAQRIINGEKVGENWLKGRLKKELIEFGYCKLSDFSKYNSD